MTVGIIIVEVGRVDFDIELAVEVAVELGE